MAATDPLVPGARARALREYVSVPESTNIARLRAFAADMWIALVRRNEIASEKAMEKPGDCKFFSGNTTGVSLQPGVELYAHRGPAERCVRTRCVCTCLGVAGREARVGGCARRCGGVRGAEPSGIV